MIYGTLPIELPGTTTSYFPSGLKKVTGTIIAKSNGYEAAVALAGTHGQVHPQPELKKREAGLIEIPFSAYSLEGGGSDSRGAQLVSLSKSFSEKSQVGSSVDGSGNVVPVFETFNWTITETYLVDTVTYFRVVNASTNSWALPDAFPLLGYDFKRRTMTGYFPQGSFDTLINGIPPLDIAWGTPALTNISRRNFGSYDEVDLTYSLLPAAL